MPSAEMQVQGGWGADQAEGLRSRLATARRPVRVICVTSGKGGVGKTSVTVNLGTRLARAGRKVLILDADLGLANVDVLLGLHPRYNLSHLLSGERRLEEIMLEGPAGLRVVPATSGNKRMTELSAEEHAGVVNAFGALEAQVDTLLIDTAAGLSDSIVTFAQASHEVVVVICNEPASLTDAYALIKLLSRDFGVERFHVLTNRVSGSREGHELFDKLLKVTDRFLDVTLAYLGAVPEDPQLRRSVLLQQPVVDLFPSSRAALAFGLLAERIESWPVLGTPSGRLQFFLERLINR